MPSNSLAGSSAAVTAAAGLFPWPVHLYSDGTTSFTQSVSRKERSMNGRAAIYHGPDQPFELREFPLPEVEPDAILVRVSMAGVCGSDLHIWRGELPGRFHAVAGHEMTGRVAELGAKIRTDTAGAPLAEGDRIAYAYFYPCRRCYVCLRGELAACPNQMPIAQAGSAPYFTGAFADYYYLRPGHFVFKVPDELPDEMVAPVNCALAQVIYGLHRAGLRFGDSVVMQGAGGLGLNAAAVAREMGARQVIAVDGIRGRLELARAFGATETIDITELSTPQERITAVRELTGGVGADVVCDFVGLASVIPEGIEMLRNGGTYLEVGNISTGATTPFEPSRMVFTSRRLVGVYHYDPWVIPAALDFLVRNRSKYPFDQVVSHRYPLDQIDRAHADAEWLNRDPTAATVTRAVLVP
jgi:D-arabinose 1-dehydrogenase-like Zn-dependent alcohol dehydrogenase